MVQTKVLFADGDPDIRLKVIRSARNPVSRTHGAFALSKPVDVKGADASDFDDVSCIDFLNRLGARDPLHLSEHALNILGRVISIIITTSTFIPTFEKDDREITW